MTPNTICTSSDRKEWLIFTSYSPLPIPHPHFTFPISFSPSRLALPIRQSSVLISLYFVFILFLIRLPIVHLLCHLPFPILILYSLQQSLPPIADAAY